MFLKRFICASTVGLLCCLPLLAQESATGATVEELVSTALERNQEYRAAQERLAETEALIRQAGSRPAPTIEFETAIGSLLRSQGEAAYSAAFFQPIETGGKRSKRLTVAEKDVALTKANIRERERELRFSVKTRFIAASLELLKLEAVRRQRPLVEESYKLVAHRVQLGDAAPLEQQLLLAEMNRMEADQVLLTASGEAALLDLRVSAGLEGTEPPKIVAELRLPDRIAAIETLQETALQRRADLEVLRILDEQAAAEAALAKADGVPDVTVSARYAHVQSAEIGLTASGAVIPTRDRDNLLIFGVSIPLASRVRTRTTVEAAESRQTQYRFRREHLLRVIPQEVQAAYRRWTGALRSLEIMRTGVIEPSEKNLSVIREAYRLGQLRLLDVLQEQRRTIDLQFAYLGIQAEAARALADLERAVGGTLP